MGYQYGVYVRRHNPFAFYSDVVNYFGSRAIWFRSTVLVARHQANRLANFTWISPDLDHDAHNGCSDQEALEPADDYLQTFFRSCWPSRPFSPAVTAY